jgi:hypothetical protein
LFVCVPSFVTTPDTVEVAVIAMLLMFHLLASDPVTVDVDVIDDGRTAASFTAAPDTVDVLVIAVGTIALAPSLVITPDTAEVAVMAAGATAFRA